MALSKTDQERIVAQESAWISDNFAPLDLSAFPALNELPSEQHRDDNRFARAYGDTALSRSGSALRDFVANPDVDALTETGHPEFFRDIRDRRGEEVAMEFKRRCPGYLPTDQNYRDIVRTLAFNALSVSEQEADTDDLVDTLIERGYWTPAKLEACYRALDREGLLQVPAGTARNLNDSELLRVQRLASSGRCDEAIGEFLKCSLDEEPSMELINDPAYRDVCDRAVLYVWELSRADYSPSPERRDFIRRYVAGRPMTLALLDAAWVACQANERRHERGELLSPLREVAPDAPENLDALDDASVENLYHRALKTYADSVRRPSGVLA